jgi:hypothetical protein
MKAGSTKSWLSPYASFWMRDEILSNCTRSDLPLRFWTYMAAAARGAARLGDGGGGGGGGGGGRAAGGRGPATRASGASTVAEEFDWWRDAYFIATPRKDRQGPRASFRRRTNHIVPPRAKPLAISPFFSHHPARVRKSGCKAPRPPPARARPAQGPARAPAQRPAATAAATAAAAAAAAAARTLVSQPWPSASSRAWSSRRVAPTRSGGRASTSQRCAAGTAVRAAGALCGRGGERSACARSGPGWRRRAPGPRSAARQARCTCRAACLGLAWRARVLRVRGPLGHSVPVRRRCSAPRTASRRGRARARRARRACAAAAGRHQQEQAGACVPAGAARAPVRRALHRGGRQHLP